MNETRKPIRIATRGSALALWQANFVKGKLARLGHQVELVLVETQGDREQTAFRDMEGVGFFTKAVQDAVLAGDADVAVHSHKDLPSAPTPGLEVAAISERADARDVLLIRPECFVRVGGRGSEVREQGAEVGDRGSEKHLTPHSSRLTLHSSLPLKGNAIVGTSAARRQSQLKHLRPDLRVQELRGNVPSRLQKLRDGQYDAIVLAAAGLERLELDVSDLKVITLEPEVFVPAPAQGVLALECRRTDYESASMLTDVHDIDAYRTVAAERGLMEMLQGGCQLALGAHAIFENGLVKLRAWYEGKHVLVEHPSSEGAAMLAYEALGRPQPREVEV